ncbi:MAG: hypothetical protein FWE79_02525 [Firmicutes bacterium]|nr:hypothetical protein [Bacillota bacterium]
MKVIQKETEYFIRNLIKAVVLLAVGIFIVQMFTTAHAGSLADVFLRTFNNLWQNSMSFFYIFRMIDLLAIACLVIGAVLCALGVISRVRKYILTQKNLYLIETKTETDESFSHTAEDTTLFSNYSQIKNKIVLQA